MGIINYARNPETKKAYDLGKGAWVLISESGHIDASDEFKLQESITKNVITRPGWTQEAVDDINYHKGIAKALSRLGNRLELVNDMSISDPVEGFELVGTRYVGMTNAKLTGGGAQD